MKIDLEKLIELKEKKFTDREAAEYFHCDRTAISQLRKKHDIPGAQSFMTTVRYVADKLTSMGFNVQNMKEDNKNYPYDLLVNGKKIDVTGAKADKRGAYKFTLCDGSHTGVVESETRVKLPGGKMRKLFRKTCDYIICVGIDEKMCWVIDSNHLPDTLVTLALVYNPTSKYYPYFEAWHKLG